MTHFVKEPIRRREDRSIDMEYYFSIARRQRSDMMHDRSQQLLMLSGVILGKTARYAARTARSLVAFL